MDNPQPDFGIVERTWEGRLRERGLAPSRVNTGIITGYQRLELYRQETQAVVRGQHASRRFGFRMCH